MIPAVYVNHPPLILWQTATAEVVLGEQQWVRRLPAWGGTLAAVYLLSRVLRREHVGTQATALGLLAAFGTPMVFAYGAMLDTPVTSLPFGIWCLLVWQRERDGDTAAWERPLSCAAAILSGWQAGLLAVITLVPRATRSVRAVCGLVAGLVATVSWQLWGGGGLSEVVGAMTKRSGLGADSDMSLLDAVRNQADWLLTQLFTPAPVGLSVLGLWLWRKRQITWLVTTAVILYPIATADGAGQHPYWMFWLAIPIGLGVAALADRRGDLRPLILGAGLVVAGVALFVRSSHVEVQDYGVKRVRQVAANENAERD